MKVRGRPCKDGSKSERITIRLDKDEFEKLMFLSEKTGVSASDVLRNGIRIQHNIHK